jgi:tetratricopeptide (TPR) repeat protein
VESNLDQRSYTWVWASVLVALAGCEGASHTTATHTNNRPAGALPAASALELVLAPHEGDHALDAQIRRLQQRIPKSFVQAEELDRLGWVFIHRARELSDPGSYNLALQCALAIEAIQPHSHAALLLRGHALQSLHHFAEAERVARALVAERGLAFDFGLLGDVLVDRGALDEAVANYQRMMDIRPDTHAYARAAHVRYLKGDLAGALKAMEVAARSASVRNRESFAWTWAKLAAYQLQSGDAELALDSVQRAIEVSPDSYHARRVEASIRLAQDDPERAITPLRAAAARTPHPEVLWMLIEALEQTGRTREAEVVRAQLLAVGATEDPRAFALYLATQGQLLEAAERLARSELTERRDVYSYEALAWVQAAQGQLESALQNARRSLAAGSDDPRLYYHAGLIAERAGALPDARAWLERAEPAARTLLPSQRALLAARLAVLRPANKRTAGQWRASPPLRSYSPERTR